LEPPPGLLQVRRLKPFGEPAVDRGQYLLGVVSLALLLPQPREARRRAQLQRLGLLAARHGEGLVEQASAWGMSGLGSWSHKAPWSRCNSASHHCASVVATSVTASSRTCSPTSGWPAWPYASASKASIEGRPSWANPARWSR